MKKDAPLTPKQEAFALAYVETGNASEAYRQCYDVSPKTKPKTVNEAACRLLVDRKVAARVEQIRKELAERKKIGLDDLVDMLKKNWEAATESPAVGSEIVMKMATLLGHNVDRKKVEVDDGPNRVKASADDRARALELLRKLGVEIPAGAGGAGAPGAGASEFPILRANHRGTGSPN